MAESAAALETAIPLPLQRPAAAAATDDAVWKALREAEALESACIPWLQLQTRMIAPDAAGLVLLKGDGDRLIPAATVPADRPTDPMLLRLAELAIRQRRGVVGMTQAGAGAVAYPITLGEQTLGAAAIACKADASQAMRQLQWGTAYLRDRASRQALGDAESEIARNGAVLDLLAVILDEERFHASALAAATHLALAFDCDRVSIGLVRRGSAKIVAISHSASFGKQMLLVRKLGAAMDEAIDQRAVVSFPPAGDDVPLATRAHAALVEDAASAQLLTVPMLVRDEFRGAVLFERPADRPFDAAQADILNAVVAALGPVLEERRLNDRWVGFKLVDAGVGVARRLFGPGHAVLKASAAALLLVAAFLSLATAPYDVSAKASLEGMLRRAIVAPLDGFIKSAPVRAGDRVEQGALLAAIDDSDLTLERLRWATERQQRQIEYDRAFAARDRSALATSRAQIDEADAQIKLVDEQLARLQLKAPFPALVIAGDLSQSIGGAVSRGQTLFEVAPLDAYRVNLAVDQSQIGDIEVGQEGQVLFAAVPEQPFAFVVDKITPVAEARDGHTVFRVEGRLTGAPDRLRPGMDGIARIGVDTRLLLWIWARSFLDWVQIATWQWLR